MKFQGIITALVTPFLKGRVDYKSLKYLVKTQLDMGVARFVVNGTTAESPTLTSDEVEKIFKTVRSVVGKEVPLILGAGDNSTARTVAKIKTSSRWQPDAYLLVTPYYNRPTQEGVYQHFKQASLATKKPIILYNVPTRTAVNMSLETVARLAKIKNIVGIKEASGNLDVAKKMAQTFSNNFSLLSGDDSSAIEFGQHGGHGVISVVSHLIPAAMIEIFNLAKKGDSAAKVLWESEFSKLNSFMGIEPNPTPVKQALKDMGIIASAEMRLPLVSMTKANAKLLKLELQNKGLI